MSSYIPKQPKRERDQISIKLDRELLRKLELYGRFLDSSRDYIIGAALDLVFRKDKTFAAWLETQGSAGEAVTVSRPVSTVRRGQKADGPNEDSKD